MNLKERLDSFAELGKILRNSLSGSYTEYSSELNQLIKNQQYKNPWFTPEYVTMAVKSIGDVLTYENLIEWTGHYPALDCDEILKNVAVVMAGNIPLVGFHDFLSVLISGNRLIGKTSSRDPDLIVFISKILCRINHKFTARISFTEGLLKGFDAVIATGSNNTSRYFDYYFSKYPNIIRKNRNSLAIIDDSESNEELTLLGRDIFSYFGLGCRSVSKIYLPAGYEIKNMIRHWTHYSDIINHNKYGNNYDYNKAVYIVTREEFIDTGYLLMKCDKGISSPVAVLYFEFYDSINNVYTEIERVKDKIQCIIGRGDTRFGNAQNPALWDYADGLDTLDFLLKKNQAGIF